MNHLGSKLLGLLAAILGISTFGCSPAYGVPPPPPPATAEYKLSGRVGDAKTGQAIPGIFLGFQGGYWGMATTDADGAWSMDVRGSYYKNGTFTLDVRDTDGVTNGSFERVTLTLSLQQTKAGAGDLDAGVFEQSGIVASLYPIECRLSGKVVDSTDTSKGISGITLTFQTGTTTSAADGTWSLDVAGAVLSSTDDLGLAASDTDGAVNGSYSDTVLWMAPLAVPGAGNEGVYEQKDIQVLLAPKP